MSDARVYPKALRNLHRWAIAVTIATFPLIWLGGLVTTYDAGMAVPDWPGTYGYNLWLYPWTTWIFGPFDLFVEHGHRLNGTVVGFLSIGFCIASYRSEPRRWAIQWAFAVLIAVILQGALGGLRVVLDARTLAMIHGCTGPLFFAMATATAVMTSRWWREVSPTLGRAPIRTSTAMGLLAASICQLIIGAQLRHIQPWAEPRHFLMFVHLHLTFAAIVTLGIGWVAFKVSGRFEGETLGISRPAGLLVLLVLVQLGLGIGTWISNYALPWPNLTQWLAQYTIQAKGFAESLIVTGHQATGSLIIALATVLYCSVARLNRNSK